MADLMFKIDTIGDNTLLGMLTYKEDGNWKIKDVRGANIFVEYRFCNIGVDELSRNLAHLYSSMGVKTVTLTRKIPPRTNTGWTDHGI